MTSLAQLGCWAFDCGQADAGSLLFAAARTFAPTNAEIKMLWLWKLIAATRYLEAQEQLSEMDGAEAKAMWAYCAYRNGDASYYSVAAEVMASGDERAQRIVKPMINQLV